MHQPSILAGRVSLFCAAATLGAVAMAIPQEPAPPSTAPAASAPAIPSQEVLEKRFADMLDNAVLRGTFAMTGAEGLKGKAPLSTPRIERYAIDSAVKREGDRWTITARVQFMEKDVRLPVPVRVVWACDTPVIALDKINLPMLGTYSARVVLHEGFYAGTWSGPNYGGVLSGQIIKAEDEERIIEMEEAREEKENATTKPVDSDPASSKTER
jgi:hypothetical protein